LFWYKIVIVQQLCDIYKKSFCGPWGLTKIRLKPTHARYKNVAVYRIGFLSCAWLKQHMSSYWQHSIFVYVYNGTHKYAAICE